MVMDLTERHIRAQVRKILSEELISPPDIPGTMSFYHGGNLDDYNDIIAQKNGRYEYGPGLYIISHYDTARKYAKGSRKLYLVTVEKGVDIQYATLDVENVKDFINTYVIGSKRKEILERIQQYFIDGKIKAYIFNTVILNEKAIKATNTRHLREFYVNNGIDYEIVFNPFGWGEEMMVLYNMKKIINTIQVKPGDKIKYEDLSKKDNG